MFLLISGCLRYWACLLTLSAESDKIQITRFSLSSVYFCFHRLDANVFLKFDSQLDFELSPDWIIPVSPFCQLFLVRPDGFVQFHNLCLMVLIVFVIYPIHSFLYF